MRYLLIFLLAAPAAAQGPAVLGGSPPIEPGRLSTGWLEIELVHPAPEGCRYTSSRVTQRSATLWLECGERPEPSTEDVVALASSQPTDDSEVAP